jgi:lysophospholipid acyltransferase (LPLAT)-like uncharacterized protein
VARTAFHDAILSVVNLPGRFAIVVGKPITVAMDADDAALERVRQTVERELNAVTARAGNRRGSP